MTGIEIHDSRFMSDTESLMWTAEKDPWLSSGMGSLFLLDAAPDFERFREKMLAATTTMIRLQEKVDEGTGIATPRWVIDPHFDIDEHVRHVRIPNGGGIRSILDLAAQVFQDPFDANRPLWQFVAVEADGDQGVYGAVILKLHHSVSDGIGAIRLAELYMDFERHPEPVPEVKLASSFVADPESQIGALASEVGHVASKHIDLIRRAAAEVSLWGADRDRIWRTAGQAGALVKAASSQLGVGQNSGPAGGSPMWKSRSRRRHLEVTELSLDVFRTASKKHGCSINDLFVAGAAIAAASYHEERGVEVAAFNVSFIISTRDDDVAGGNAFAPVPFSIDAMGRSPKEVVELVRHTMAEKRAGMSAGSADVTGALSGIANMLPGALLTRAVRAQSAKLDFATSNLRATPFPIYVAGAEITHMYPIGPLGGTAFNLTAMSYNGTFFFGIFVDPVAVDDPAALKSNLIAAYNALLV